MNKEHETTEKATIDRISLVVSIIALLASIAAIVISVRSSGTLPFVETVNKENEIAVLLYNESSSPIRKMETRVVQISNLEPDACDSFDSASVVNLKDWMVKEIARTGRRRYTNWTTINERPIAGNDFVELFRFEPLKSDTSTWLSIERKWAAEILSELAICLRFEGLVSSSADCSCQSLTAFKRGY